MKIEDLTIEQCKQILNAARRIKEYPPYERVINADREIGYEACFFCGEDNNPPYFHLSDCPWANLKEILGG